MNRGDRIRAAANPPKPNLQVVRPEVASIPRADAEGVHPYAEAIRRAWLDRLDGLTRPWVKGAAWNDNCFVTARKLIELANSPWAGYSLAQAHGDYMAHAPYDHAWDQREKCWSQADEYTKGAGLPEPPPGQMPDLPAVTVLDVPDLSATEESAFWSSRDLLTHIHTFARARMVAPWAVLGVTLARILTATPVEVCLPPIIGSRASLNYFVGLVGKSGDGKGAAETVAAEAVNVGYIESHNVGSGEGIAHGYKHRAKGQLVWNDDRHAVLFSVPEIDSLAAQGDRKGATLMPQLRSGWTGEQLGFGYADPMKRIIVEAHQYRLCLVAGIQPLRAGCLLNDVDGGTPQRFLWVPAIDLEAPAQEPAAPASIDVIPPPTSSLAAVGGMKIDVCQTARHTIKEARRARNRGDGDALDGHALLAQLKTAAALGIAEGRYSVTDEDWALAEVIIHKSAATRAAVVQALSAKAHEANYGRAEAEGKRAVIIAEQVADAAVKRVCSAITRKLIREDDWVASNLLRRAVPGRDRSHFEGALERLTDAGQLESQILPSKNGKGIQYRLKDRS